MSEVDPHSCNHTTLNFNPSSHAAIAGYKRPSAQQRAAAATRSGHVKAHQDIEIPEPGTYPAPLVLPGDDLALDPTYPPQSLRAWLREKDRNPVTPQRKTIYVAAPPDVDPAMECVKGWCIPRVAGGVKGGVDLSPPGVMDVVRYLRAFYHGMHVELLPSSSGLRFAAWDDEDDTEAPEKSPAKTTTRKGGKTKAKPKSKTHPSKSPPFIALQSPTEATRIRTRHFPTTSSSRASSPSLSTPYPSQLNLSDLLDAAIALPPPRDAYALLLLVTHDLYEDDDDDFVCGRAYGGSRVAVVSSARYDPRLDARQGVYPGGELHAWPGSCCAAFVEGMCRGEGRMVALGGVARGGGAGGAVAGGAESQSVSSPVMRAVIAAAAAQARPELQPPLPIGENRRQNHQRGPHRNDQTRALWLPRVCKTASHELGHCFGIDHCIYYSCVMQGTAGLAEDARQPPYLCPIDEVKLGVAVAAAAAAAAGAATDTNTAATSTAKTAKTTKATTDVIVIDDSTDAEIEVISGKRFQTVGKRREKIEKVANGKKDGKRGRGADGSGTADKEMEILKIWKRERRGRLRDFCSEIMGSEGEGVAAAPFWMAYDAWLGAVGEAVGRR